MSFGDRLFSNPEFLRLLRSKLRLKSMVMLAALAVAAFGAILFGMYWDLTYGGRGTTVRQMLRNYFFTVTGIQLAIVTFYGLSQAAQVITVEREKHTYDFQRLVAMGPGPLALGKLLGGPCPAWWLALCALPFAWLPVVGQAVSAGALFQSQLIVFLFGLTISALGMLFSSLYEKTAQATGMLVLLSLVFFYGGAAFVALNFRSSVSPTLNLAATIDPVAMLRLLGQPSYRQATFSVFGLALPAIWGFIALHLLIVLLIYRVVVRRILDEELSLVAPRDAAQLFAVFQALLILGCRDLFYLDQHAGMAAFHSLNAIMLVLLPFGVIPSGESLRSRVFRGAKNEHWRIFFEKPGALQDSPPTRFVLILVAAYVLESVALNLWWGEYSEAAAAVVIMVACASIAMASLLLYLQLYVERRGLRAGFAVLLVSLTVPPCLLASLEMSWDYSINVSPVVYLKGLPDLLRNDVNLGPLQDLQYLQTVFACPLACLILAVTCSVLAALRMRFLLDMRELERIRESQAVLEKTGGTGGASWIPSTTPG